MTYRHGNTHRANSQFMRASAQYDNASPPEGPEFDEWEAMRNVADDMDADDRAVILGDLADAAGWLLWALRQDNLPKGAKAMLDLLARHARELEAKRDAEYRSLNGGP